MEYSLAVKYGTIHLNGAFVGEASKPFRLFKKSEVRITSQDIIWTIVLLFPTALLLYGLGTALSHVPILSEMMGWWVVFASPFASWFLGRLMSAKVAPYKKHSGEGLIEYMVVNRQRLRRILIWKLYGQRILYSEVESRATGKRRLVRAAHWQGTAWLQHKPLYNPHTDNSSVRIIHERDFEQTNWLEEAVRREKLRESL